MSGKVPRAVVFRHSNGGHGVLMGDTVQLLFFLPFFYLEFLFFSVGRAGKGRERGCGGPLSRTLST